MKHTTMKSVYLLLLIAVPATIIVITGCANKPPGTMSAVGAPTVESGPSSMGRFVITYQGPLVCGNPDYKNARAVYTIKDTATGEEYLGIEGVGVSSLRKVGKNSQAEH
jgi:hypothetical protein